MVVYILSFINTVSSDHDSRILPSAGIISLPKFAFSG